MREHSSRNNAVTKTEKIAPISARRSSNGNDSSMSYWSTTETEMDVGGQTGTLGLRQRGSPRVKTTSDRFSSLFQDRENIDLPPTRSSLSSSPSSSSKSSFSSKKDSFDDDETENCPPEQTLGVVTVAGKRDQNMHNQQPYRVAFAASPPAQSRYKFFTRHEGVQKNFEPSRRYGGDVRGVLNSGNTNFSLLPEHRLTSSLVAASRYSPSSSRVYKGVDQKTHDKPTFEQGMTEPSRKRRALTKQNVLERNSLVAIDPNLRDGTTLPSQQQQKQDDTETNIKNNNTNEDDLVDDNLGNGTHRNDHGTDTNHNNHNNSLGCDYSHHNHFQNQGTNYFDGNYDHNENEFDQDYGGDLDAPNEPGDTYWTLHEICRNATTTEDLLKHKISREYDVSEFAKTDHNGQTPLHVLSCNVHLANAVVYAAEGFGTPDSQKQDGSTHNYHEDILQSASFQQEHSPSPPEKQVIQFVIGFLLRNYRAAVITNDCRGYIPFQDALVQWVDQVHHEIDQEDGTTGNRKRFFSGDGMPSFLKNTVRSMAMYTPNKTAADGEGSNKDIEGGGTSPASINRVSTTDSTAIHDRDRHFPTTVALTAQALFAFKMLSAILGYLDRRIKPQVQPKRSSIFRTKYDENDSYFTAMDGLRNQTVEDISSEIVNTIASVPHLVKTILLISDDEQRTAALSTSIVQRVLASEFSIGTWLTAMLQSDNKHVSDKAIDYLKVISDFPLDGIGEQKHSLERRRQPVPSQVSSNDLSLEVSRLRDFVPSLLSLGEQEIEEVATTKIVKRVLDRILSRPFAVTVMFFDALFLTILIFGFRGAVSKLLLGSSPGTVLTYIYVTNIGIFYCVIRELGKAVSVFMITRKARLYFLSFWNALDLLSTLLALASTIVIRANFTDGETEYFVSNSIRNLLAITTGFLWLRILSFIKGINMQLATFVLAILQITRDILWFCVILFTLVISFAQMFFTLLVPQSCAASSDTKECSQSEYYLKVYAILLGDFGMFEREHFTTVFSVILVVFYSFMVVLVLLNILIAVASDSYEKCLVKSQSLFGRARVMLIAELVSFQHLLRRHHGKPNEDPIPSPPIYKTWWSSESFSHGWNRGSVVFFGLSSLVVFIWVVGELSRAKNGYIILSLGSIFINVIVFAGIMVALSTGSKHIVSTQNEGKREDYEGGRFVMCGEWFERFIQNTMLRLLGSSLDATSPKSDAWRGRLIFLQDEMKRISEDMMADSNEKAKFLENLINQNDTHFRTSIVSLERKLAALRSDFLQGIHSTSEEGHGPNEKLRHAKSMVGG